MSDNENAPLNIETEGRTKYGYIIRESGTRRIFILALCVGVAWFIIYSLRTHQMMQVKWQTLQPQANGLTVLGLQDKDRRGWKHKYEAVQSNNTWHIRRPDDSDSGDSDDPNSAEAQDRGSSPADTHKVNRGETVPMDELLKNCPVVMTGAQFTDASITEDVQPIFDKKYYVVHLGLTDEGRSRYWQFSRTHDQERLVFVLNGEINTVARMEHMDVSTLEIQPIWVKSDAEALANIVNKQKK